MGLAILAAFRGGGAAGQMRDTGGPAKPRGHVSYAAEPQSVPAGRIASLDLHFLVDPGYHVNSHTPKSELLIATEVKLEPEAGVSVGTMEYPAGTEFSFPIEPNEKLDVYTGAFRVRLPVEAKSGEHTLTGVLRYQACDKAACYPPRTLPVQVPFTAK